MQPIQMVDLKQQYFKIKNEINAAVRDVIESTKFVGLPKEFSRCQYTRSLMKNN